MKGILLFAVLLLAICAISLWINAALPSPDGALFAIAILLSAAFTAISLCIELGDSVMTHRRRFAMTSSRETVVDLLALDPMNPRSLRHQLDGMMDQLRLMPGVEAEGQLSRLGRAMLRLQTDVATAQPDTLDSAALLDLGARIGDLSDHLSEAYFR